MITSNIDLVINYMLTGDLRQYNVFLDIVYKRNYCYSRRISKETLCHLRAPVYT